MTISDYLDAIKERLLTEAVIIHFEIFRERATQSDGHIRARTVFIDDSQLEFSEYFQLHPEGTVKIITYSYHWSDSGAGLIRRWDNTPHFPGLQGFPHHVHNDESGLAIPGKPERLFTVLDEIAQQIDVS